MVEIRHRFTNEILFCSQELNSLRGANLYGANLYGADLYGADLSGANLRGANLYGADLSGANLSGANLYSANLSGANLYSANLSGADLSGANLSGANLYSADLYSANLRGANLYGANLYGADNAELTIAQQKILADGDILGYKKLKNNIIATLLIPKEAKRVNAIGSRKCRAEFVRVISLSEGSEGFDQHTGKTLYKVGELILPDSFNDSIYEECTNGIHFFITKEEAEAY